MKILRWILVLPLGIAIHFIIPFIYGSIDYFLNQVLEIKHFNFVPIKYISVILDILSNFYTGYLFIILPSFLAPNYNLKVANILLIFSVILFFTNVYLLIFNYNGHYYNYFLTFVVLIGSLFGNLKIKGIMNNSF